MVSSSFIEEIKKRMKTPVIFRINDNRTTMLSVKWESHCTKVSMHRIFLDAPKEVQEAVKNHVTTVNSSAGPIVRAYIQKKIQELDYSEILNDERLISKGVIYDLQELYQKINCEYFSSELDLKITWFGKPKIPGGQRITFGLYQAPLKLVKVHKMMDNVLFPKYVLEFVIYHEMLHHVVPPQFDQAGKNSIHGKEFKRREKQFVKYKQASAWLKRFSGRGTINLH